VERVFGIMPTMPKEDRFALLQDQLQELREEAAALADKIKRTARQAEVVAERINDLEVQIAKDS
jgi:septal ring factor EnvC (AmiA/AmiB activator)